MKIWVALTLIFGVQLETYAFFFENSFRRSMDDDRRALKGDSAASAVVAFMDQKCTGFFLKNSGNKNFVLTARHCFVKLENDPKNFCHSKRNYVWDPWFKIIRGCLRVVFDSPNTEVVILEVSGPSPLLALTLHTKTYEDEKRRLQMFGYPLDPLKLKGINATENCWTMPGVVDTSKEILPIFKDYIDKYTFHNCSTYFGNSGGPMVLEGTSLAVGMPGGTIKLKENQSPFMQSSRPIGERYRNGILLNFSSFVETFRDDLVREGISVKEDTVKEQILVDMALPLAPGRFYCTNDQNNEFIVKPRYNTTNTLVDVLYWYKKRDSNDYGKDILLKCTKELKQYVCKGQKGDKTLSLRIENTVRFYFSDIESLEKMCQLRELFPI